MKFTRFVILGLIAFLVPLSGNAKAPTSPGAHIVRILRTHIILPRRAHPMVVASTPSPMEGSTLAPLIRTTRMGTTAAL